MRRRGAPDLPDSVLAAPAGPLSGATVTVYTTKSGSYVHGVTGCSRGYPIPQEHDLGTGTTIADLAWPTGLHCGYGEPAAGDAAGYWSLLNTVADLETSAAVVETAADRILMTGGAGIGWWQVSAVDLQSPATVDSAWPDPAPEYAVLQQRLLERARTAAAALPAAQQRISAAVPRSISTETLITATYLDGDRAKYRNLSDAYEYRNSREPVPFVDPRTGFTRVCAASFVFSDYQPRRPGPLYSEFVDTAAETVTAAADLTYPDRRQYSGQLARAWAAINGQPAADVDSFQTRWQEAVSDAARSAVDMLTSGGQESLASHLLWGRGVNGPNSRTGGDDGTASAWLNGRKFTSFPQNTMVRWRWTQDPDRSVLLSILTHIDPVWDRMLDRVADQFPPALLVWQDDPFTGSYSHYVYGPDIEKNADVVVSMLWPVARGNGLNAAVVPGVVTRTGWPSWRRARTWDLPWTAEREDLDLSQVLTRIQVDWVTGDLPEGVAAAAQAVVDDWVADA